MGVFSELPTSSLSPGSSEVPSKPTLPETHHKRVRPGNLFASTRSSFPWIGYFAAIGIPLLTIVLTSLILVLWPAINLQGFLPLLSIILVAFFWGLGPGLVATVVGVCFLDYALFFWPGGSSFSLIALGLQTLRVLVIGIVISFIVSLTQRERLRATKQARELNTILATIADGLFVYDKQGQIVRTNPTAKEINALAGNLDYSKQPWPAHFIHPQLKDAQGHLMTTEEVPVVRVLQGEVLTREQAVDISFQQEGVPTRLFNTSGAPIRDENGEIQGAVMVLRDVTERHQRDREHLLQAQQLQALIESVPDAIIVFDQAGRVTPMNASAHQLLPRYTTRMHKDMLNRLEEVKPADIDGVEMPQEAIPTSRLLRGEILTGEHMVNVRVQTFSGEALWLNLAGAPLYDENHQVSGAVMVIRDQTVHHQQEHRTRMALQALLQFAEALVQSGDVQGDNQQEEQEERRADHVAQHLAALIGQILDYRVVCITTIDAVTEEPISTAAYGFTPEERLAWNKRQPGTTLREMLIDTPEGSSLQAGEAVVLDLSQARFQSAAAIYGAGTCLLVPMRLKERLVGILTLVATEGFYDYSDHEKALGRALAQLAALTIERAQLFQERTQEQATVLALRETNRLMDEFIGIAGHELRTPLTTIKGSVQIAQRQLARVLQQQALSPEVTTPLTTILNHLSRSERQIGTQNRLISDLLDVARVHSNRLELMPELCDLWELVLACVEDQQYLTPNRTILLSGEKSGDALVMADKDRVRQVISNYLSNALKYSSTDRPIEIRLAYSADMVCVSVQDQGPGLSLEEQQRIWERFYRVPTIEVKSGSGIGLGLGLHISRTIIERLGGQVGVKSKPGHGSTFWFALPRV